LFAASLALANSLRQLVEPLAARPRLAAKRVGGAVDQFIAGYTFIWAHWPTGTAVEQALIDWLPPPTSLLVTATGLGSVSVATSLSGATGTLLDAFEQLAIIVVMSFVLSDRPDLFWESVTIRFAGRRARPRMRSGARL
jgi:hypothetical protein